MFICMQKTSFIIDFFLTILQRYSKLVILDNLGMPGHTHLKWQYQFEEAFDVYLQENINFILHVFLDMLQRYCKLLILSTLSMSDNTNPKWYYKFKGNIGLYLQAKNRLHFPYLSGDIAKIRKFPFLSIFGMPGYPHPKSSTCRKLWCLTPRQKYTSSFTSFLRYYILNNSVILLANSILAHNLSTRILPGLGLVVKYQKQY